MKDKVKIFDTNYKDFYKEISGNIYEIKGHKFIIPYKKCKTLFNCFEVKSGSGFNIEPRNIKGLHAFIEKMGEDKFFKVVNNAKTLEEQIKEYKANIEHNKNFNTTLSMISARLGFTVYMGKCSILANRKTIDVFKLDKSLHNQGYDEDKDGSIKDYLTKKYDKEFAELIESLL